MYDYFLKNLEKKERRNVSTINLKYVKEERERLERKKLKSVLKSF